MIFGAKEETKPERKPQIGETVQYHVANGVQAAVIVDSGPETQTLVVWDKLGNPKQVLGVPRTDREEPFRWSWRPSC